MVERARLLEILRGFAARSVTVVGDFVADEYVAANGPGRNYDLTQTNGPDMRFSILEDFQEESGERFQAAIGLFETEGEPQNNTRILRGHRGRRTGSNHLGRSIEKLLRIDTHCSGRDHSKVR